MVRTRSRGTHAAGRRDRRAGGAADSPGDSPDSPDLPGGTATLPVRPGDGVSAAGASQDAAQAGPLPDAAAAGPSQDAASSLPEYDRAALGPADADPAASIPPDTAAPHGTAEAADEARTSARRPVRPQRPSIATAAWLRSHLTRTRVVVLIAVVAVLVAAIALGDIEPAPSAEPTVQAFLIDWQDGQYRAAAALTNGNPAAVAKALDSAYRQLDAAKLALAMGPISQRGTSAEASFVATIALGSTGSAWTYQGTFPLVRAGSGWKVAWSPADIVPGLRPGLRLAVRTVAPPRAQLLDARGSPLSPPSRVYVAGVIPAHLAELRQTADSFADAVGIDSGAQVLGQIEAAPAGQFLELARLAPADYRVLRRRLDSVPGLIVRPELNRLFDSLAPLVTGSVGTEVAPVLRAQGVPYRPGSTVGQSGLQLAYQRTLVGAPTVEIVAEDSAGKVVSVLRRWKGTAGQPVRTTISAPVQRAANATLAALPNSAAIVAVRADNGHILAVARHTARGMPPVSPLTGEYEPGQSFTIISTAALLAAGFGVNTPTPCRKSNQIGGQTFRNDPPEPRLGAQPPFRTDFAYSCDTAFAGVSLNLSSRDIADASDDFGIGAPWRLPLPAFTGSMRTPDNQAELAADSIGTDSVRVSPLDMALAAGVIASGSWHQPQLVVSPADPGLEPRTRVAPEVIADLRMLMRSAVRRGAARAADVPGPPVFGQVGNAAFAPGTASLRRASWFVGYQDGVAFVVIELSRSASTSAATVAGRFLRALHASS